jgi:hypothetical protein
MQKRVYIMALAIVLVAGGAYKFKIYAAHEHEVVRFDFSEQLLKDIAGMKKFSFEKSPEKQLEHFYDIKDGLQKLNFMPMHEKESVFKASINGDRPLALLIKRLGFTVGEVNKALIMYVIGLLIKAGDQFLPRELEAFEQNAVFAPKAAIRILSECDGLKEACSVAIRNIQANLALSEAPAAGHQSVRQEPHYNLILGYLNEQSLKKVKGLIKALEE